MEINKTELRKQAINAAANLVLAKPMSELYALCEVQKSISTKKLEYLLGKAQDKYREHGVLMRKLSDNLNP